MIRFKQQGVTLVELMVTLAVIAILAIIAVPGMQSILATSDLNTAQEDFVQVLKNARGYAMSRSSIATAAVNASTASITLTLADNSASAVTVTASKRVAVNEDATYTFYPVGSATISSVSGTTILSAPGIASIPSRRITVTSTGGVNVSR